MIYKSNRCSRQSGFSMVELMVALTVMMVGVTGTIITHVSASRLRNSSEETRLATAALSQAAEQARLLAPIEIFAAFPEGQPISLQDVGIPGLQVVPSYPGFVADDGVITMRLVATWTMSNGGTRALELTTAV